MRSEKMFELPEHELSESSEDQSYQHQAQEPVQPPVQLPVQEVMEAEEEEEEESSSSSEVEAAKKSKGKKKKYDSISLTDFFARKEEERVPRSGCASSRTVIPLIPSQRNMN